MDTVCANPNRYTNNFGLLRDTLRGKLLGLAPNFDNNIALISRGYPAKPKASDMLIRFFCDVLGEHPEYCEYLPEIKEETVRMVIANLHMFVKTQDVVDIVMRRYRLIK